MATAISEVQQVSPVQMIDGIDGRPDFLDGSVALFGQRSAKRRLRRGLVLSDGIVIRAMGRYELVSEGGRTTCFVTHFAAREDDMRAAAHLLEAIDAQIEAEGCAETVLFACYPTPHDELLRKGGYLAARRFPIQMVWSDLGLALASVEEPRLQGVTVEEIDSGQCADIFAQAFRPDWDWYFRHVSGATSLADRQLLTDALNRYLRPARWHLAAVMDGKIVGISALFGNHRTGRGEFHTGVGVLEEYRHRGLGEYLTYHSLRLLNSKGMTFAEVRTQSPLLGFAPQIAMYRKCGGRLLRMFALYERHRFASPVSE